jgi:Flp pilus assembly protein TadB
MNWRRFLTARSISVLCSGLAALAWVIWIDGVGLWAIGVISIAIALMVFEWVFSGPKRRSRRADQGLPGDVDYKRHFRN